MQLMSTRIDCDKNNALYGINNDTLQYTLLSSNTIELTCLLDTNKVNSKFTITSKISEDSYSGGDLFIYTTGIGVSNVNNINFITA